MLKKILLACFLFFTGSLLATAQEKKSYPVLIRFTSECCGVPDSKPIYNFLRSFKKQQNIKRITLYHIGPLGREGEYDLAFTLKEMNKKQAKLFKTKISEITKKLKGKGKATYLENEEIDLSGLDARATIKKQVI